MITMYGADWCGDCRRAKTYFDERGVAYDYLDVAADGFDTTTGGHGSNFRVGRSSASPSRALLKDLPILILDEATSALNPKAARQVQAGLDELMVGRTALVMAHRL